MRVYVPKEAVELLTPRPDLALRLVEADESMALARPLYERVRPTRVGAVSRSGAWWTDEWFDADDVDPNRRFDVVVEDGGEVVGHALYAVEGPWTDGFTQKVVLVRDLVAATDAAEAALWRYLLEIDQTVGVRAWNMAPDLLLPWLLTDARQVRTESVRDFLWIRPIDTAALLAARTYPTGGSLVIEITDPFLGLDATAGRFLLDGGDTGATCARTDRAPDLAMTVDVLGAICLGGVRPSTVARSGRLIAADASVLARADAMFRAEREPYAFTWF